MAHVRGAAHPSTTLTEDDVREIDRRLSMNERVCDLAKRYRVSASTISRIRNRRVWQHVTVPA